MNISLLCNNSVFQANRNVNIHRKSENKNHINSTTSLNSHPCANYAKVNFGKILQVENGHKISRRKLENYTGCMLGGAIGDALGAPVEFFDLNQIKRLYGEKGVVDLEFSKGGKAKISDDTQMTIFTADGLIKSIGQKFRSNEAPEMDTLHDSYLHWLDTQKREDEFFTIKGDRGWISKISALYERRGPGETCLTALRSGIMGTISSPINKSKGNGGVMRVAPAGLLYYNNPKTAFEVGARSAAITHGHPSGYLAAGAFASILAYIVKGENIENAVSKTIDILKKYKNNEEVKEALQKAVELASSDIEPENAIKQIGGGWVGEEAVAIAVYCALKSQNNFETAVRMSVNHNGDSDSTGAITGNLMGLYLGANAIPKQWVENIEIGKELHILSDDIFHAPFRKKQMENKYPYNRGRIPNWYNPKQPVASQSKIQHVKFSKHDQAKMKQMSVQERIDYKRYLMRNNLYSTE